MDHFNTIKTLGEGSFGSALLVQDKISRKQYVVKKIPLYNLNEVEREEAMKEVEVLSQMKHPNIISYHKSFEENNTLFIVTDYCDGGDLYSRIRAQKGCYFEEDQILDWFVQISLAVKHVHDRRTLHRDIKTQNIFLTKSGIAKLGDFGIARVLSSTSDLAKTCIGTPYYLSPEICENKPYNNKSDVWSLGCVLYELSSLKHAFEASNIKSLIFKILKGSVPQIPNKYSPELRNLVTQIFVRNPIERPSVNAILKNPLILERISKFLNQTKIKEEFNQTGLKTTKSSDPKKVGITNPASKYGVSIARKQISKPVRKYGVSKKSETNIVLKNINLAKNPPKSHLNKGNKVQTSSRNLTINKKDNLQLRKTNTENIPVLKDNASELSNSNKSIIELSAIELRETSLKVTLPNLLGQDNKIPTLDSQPSASDSENEGQLSHTSSSSSACSCFDDSGVKTAFQINLPHINSNCISRRSKWSKCNIDFLKDLPLETTASKMDSTSPNDKVIRHQIRPHSAPHTGRTGSALEKTEGNNMFREMHLSANKKTCNSLEDINNAINSVRLTSLNKKKENNSKPSFNTNENLNSFDKGINLSSQNSNIKPFTLSQTYKVCGKKEKEERTSPEVNDSPNMIGLPSIQTNNQEIKINQPLPKILSASFHLPSVEGLSLKNSDKNKTYLLKRNYSCSSIGKTHLPTLLEEKFETYSSNESLSTDDSMESKSLSKLSENGTNKIISRSLSEEESDKSEIGVQCNLSPICISLPSTPCKVSSNCHFPSCWSLSQFKSSSPKKKLKKRCHSLPDLTIIACVTECSCSGEKSKNFYFSNEDESVS